MTNQEIEDPDLRRLVDQLLGLARAEVSVRAALSVTGPQPRKRKTELANEAKRIVLKLKNDEALASDASRHAKVKRAYKGLVRCTMGYSRARNLKGALDALRSARKQTRVQVNELASSLGVTVPPLQIDAPGVSIPERDWAARRSAELLGTLGDMDAVDDALAKEARDD